MTDATYVSKVHGEGADKLTIENGGTIEINSGGTLDIKSGATILSAADVAITGATTLANTLLSASTALDVHGTIALDTMGAMTLAAGATLKEANTQTFYAGNQFYRVAVAHVDATAAGAGTMEAHATTIKIPDKAIVTKAWICVTTQPASAANTAEIAVHVQGANDLVTATVVRNAQWQAGIRACVPVGSAATMIKMTAQRTITYTVTTQALTDGKFDVYVEYMPGN